MLVFIDESGDSGLKFEGNSSKELIVTLVLFEDREEAQRADDRITSLRRELGLHPQFEFHFSKLKQDWRERFLKEAGLFEFIFFAIIFDKAALKRQGLSKPTDLYRHACNLVFQTAKPYLKNANVIMDGSGSQKFRMELATYLRRHTNGPGDDGGHIHKVRLQDSRSNNLLQLADMVCGAIARSLTTKPRAKICRQLIAHCEMDVTRWPK